MNFCNRCGAALQWYIPAGDNRERHVCDDCGTVHYQNPRIVAGCLITDEDRILLCQRSIEPRSGFWTLPAGFLESGETIEAGAARETREEACAEVHMEGLYTIFSLPHISQIYMFFRARLAYPEYGPGDETLACAWYSESTIPWENLAFPVVGKTIKHFFEDRPSGNFPVHTRDIILPMRR